MKRFIYYFAFMLIYHCARGAPIAAVMGCGKKGKLLSPEKQTFCCEQFNLDCPPTGAVAVDSMEVKNVADTDFKVHIRALGDRCKPPLYVCGVGLICKQGLCFRNKTRAHLEQLMSRGLEVEEEERHQIGEEEDVEDKDPLPAQKGLILEGQSLQLNVRERNPSFPFKTHKSGSAMKEKNDINALNLEEDELAENIGDLLSRKMGVKLNAKQLHKVREVIAGTFDERAEREEQIDDSEGLSGFGSHDTGNADVERPTVRSAGMEASTHTNDGRKNSSPGDSTSEAFDSLNESELRRVKGDCDSPLNPNPRRSGMQCPATRQRQLN